MLEVLKREGYIRGFSQSDEGHKELSIELKYHNGEPVIKELRASPSLVAASIPA